MRRFVLTAMIAVIASAYFATSASAIPTATLSCRKAGGDSRTYAQPLPGGSTAVYELKNVMVSS